MTWKFVGRVLLVILVAGSLLVIALREPSRAETESPVVASADVPEVNIGEGIVDVDVREGGDTEEESLTNLNPATYHQLAGTTYEIVEDPIYDMITKRSGYLSKAQRGRYDELHIIPWNPKVGEDCSQAPESVFVSRVCKPVYESRFSHPYEQLSFDELTTLPDSDAAALYYLSRKGSHLKVDQRIDLVVRAAAVSGKPGELFAVGRILKHLPGSALSELEVLRLKQTLEIVASRMGDERADPDLSWAYLEPWIEEDPGPEKVKAQSAANEMLAEMNRVSIEVVGLPVPREVSD